MDLSLSVEQNMLQDSVRKFVRDNYAFEQRQQIVSTELGYDLKNWAMFNELGWFMIPFSEEDGGLGGSSIEIMLLMEEFGKGLVVEPYFSTVVLAGGLLKNAASPEHKNAWLTPIIADGKRATFAYAEPQGRFNLADVSTSAKQNADGWVVNGHKSVVLNAPSADFILFSARTSGSQTDADGISLFVVAASASGLEMRDYPTMDGFKAAEVYFNNLQVGSDAVIGELGMALPLISSTIDEATVALCAEAVGCMEILYKDTVTFSKQRKQFGVPIGSFQVLQHRMVDMFVEYEQSKSLLYMAAMSLAGDDDVKSRMKAVSALKVQIGKAGKFIGQGAVQIHGGMGMTDELNIGHYFKRLTAIEVLFGDSDYHLERFGQL